MSLSARKALFIPGGQLLTNLEEYSFKVQQEAESYALKIRAEADQYKIDLEQSLAEVESKREKIENEIASMLDNARQEAEKILAQAQQEGYNAGHSEAQAKFDEDIEYKAQNLEKVVHELENLRRSVYLEVESEILDLSLLVAKKILYNELRTNKDLVKDFIKAKIGKMAGQGRIKIFLNEVDYAYILSISNEVKKLLDENQTVLVMQDNTLSSGSVRLVSDFSEIEHELQKEQKNIESKLAKVGELRRSAYE